MISEEKEPLPEGSNRKERSGNSNRTIIVIGAFSLLALGILTSPQDESAETKLAQGVAAYQAGRVDEAKKTYAEVLQRDPGNVVASYNLGVAAHEENDNAEAERLYRAALEGNPDFAPALFNFAILMESTNRDELAAQAYQRILTTNPNDAPVRVNYGYLLVEKLNRRAEGESEFMKAIELDPNLASRIPIEFRPGSQPDPSPAPS